MSNETDNEVPESDDLVVTENDVEFECPHCENILIVDKEGAGLELCCPHCEEPVIVPFESSASSAPKRDDAPVAASEPIVQSAFHFGEKSPEGLIEHIDKLERQLKENASQRTEIQGYINQETIKLHRHKLQLEKLVDKNGALEAEHHAAKQAAGN